jgi:hypothetical protein
VCDGESGRGLPRARRAVEQHVQQLRGTKQQIRNLQRGSPSIKAKNLGTGNGGSKGLARAHIGCLEGVGEHPDDLLLVRHILHLPRPAAVPGRAAAIRANHESLTANPGEIGGGSGGRLTISPPMAAKSARAAPSAPPTPLPPPPVAVVSRAGGVEWRAAPALRALRFLGAVPVSRTRVFCSCGPGYSMGHISHRTAWIPAQHRPRNTKSLAMLFFCFCFHLFIIFSLVFRRSKNWIVSKARSWKHLFMSFSASCFQGYPAFESFKN